MKCDKKGAYLHHWLPFNPRPLFSKYVTAKSVVHKRICNSFNFLSLETMEMKHTITLSL